MAQDRVEKMERQLRELTRRIDRLEGEGAPKRRAAFAMGAAAPAPAPQPARAAAPPTRQAAPKAPRLNGAGLEELFGGRVLAWLGGIAIFLGILFFLGMAISRGWIDEPTRIALALLGSTSLLLTGVWLHESKGRVEAALAATASAIAGLFATVLVATQVYDLIAVGPGLAAAALIAVVAVAIAVRWDSAIVGSLGILGALAAPVLVGAGTSDATLAFMTVSLVAAVAVLLWQRWDWLALGAFAVSAPQLVVWFENGYEEHLAPALLALVVFWLLYAIAAIGHEVRARTGENLSAASWLLILASVALIAPLGYFGLEETGHTDAGVAWILGLSAAQIVLGAVALRQPISREIGSLLIAIGLGLSALGFADALDGPALVVGWAVQAVVLAFLATRADASPSERGSSAERLLFGGTAFAALAFGHTLMIEAPASGLIEGVPDLAEAVVALASCAAMTFAFGMFARRVDAGWAALAEFLGAGAIVYLVSIGIVDQFGVTETGDMRQAGQVWLSAFWTLTGLGAVIYGLRQDSKRFRLAGLALLGLAIAKVYTYDLSELDEIARVLSFIGLGLLLLVGAFAYQRIGPALSGEEAEAAR